MRVIEARGPWVEALKRHDSGLRVRWSFEKKKWAVDAPARRQDMLVPPVRFERIAESDSYIEHLLPEHSDRNISYRDHRYIICTSPHVDRRLYEAILKRDVTRLRGGFVGAFNDNLRARNEALFKQRENTSKELAYAAFDKFKFMNNKYPWLAPADAGVSLRDWKEPVPSYERKQNV